MRIKNLVMLKPFKYLWNKYPLAIFLVVVIPVEMILIDLLAILTYFIIINII